MKAPMLEQVAEHQAQAIGAVRYQLEIHQLDRRCETGLHTREVPQTHRGCRQQDGTAQPAARHERKQRGNGERQEGMEIRKHHRS